MEFFLGSQIILFISSPWDVRATDMHASIPPSPICPHIICQPQNSGNTDFIGTLGTGFLLLFSPFPSHNVSSMGLLAAATLQPYGSSQCCGTQHSSIQKIRDHIRNWLETTVPFEFFFAKLGHTSHTVVNWQSV